MKTLNESYTFFEKLNLEDLKKLTCLRPDIRYNVKVQAGIIDQYNYYYNKVDNGFVVPTGLVEYLGYYKKPEIPRSHREKLTEIIDSFGLPFKPYDYQYNAVIEAYFYRRLFIKAATGAGKSLIIGLITKLLTKANLKGIIIVPNIGLTKQFDDDIKSYKLNIETRLIGGENNIKEFDKPLTISTWQSVSRMKSELSKLDFVIVDEAHGIKGNELFDICNKCQNAKYKIGLSGTLPEEDDDMMKLMSTFGVPKTYITPRGLIDRGLATDVKINIIKLDYKNLIINSDQYSSHLKAIKEYKPRTDFIVKLSDQVSKSGNTLVLFQHTQHGFDLFYGLFHLRKLESDRRTYKDLIQQKFNHIYFINGLIEGENREIIRKILENETNAIIVANYAVMSTGVNIKALHNMILASPLKSYTTITQSIGRGLRLHKDKEIFKLYDISDQIGFFKHQLNHRLQKSYNPEGYDIFTSSYTI